MSSTFSCDIAYSDSPTASRACARVRSTRVRSRSCRRGWCSTTAYRISVSMPLAFARPLIALQLTTTCSPASINSSASTRSIVEVVEPVLHVRPHRVHAVHRRPASSRAPSAARQSIRASQNSASASSRTSSPRLEQSAARPPRSPATSPAQYPVRSTLCRWPVSRGAAASGRLLSGPAGSRRWGQKEAARVRRSAARGGLPRGICPDGAAK